MNEILQSPISTIGSYGLLGALLIVAGAVIYVLSRALSEAQEARMNDQKELGQLAKDMAVVLANFTSSNDARTRALEASARSQEASAAALGTMSQGFSSYGDSIGELSREFQRMRDALIKRGIDL